MRALILLAGAALGARRLRQRRGGRTTPSTSTRPSIAEDIAANDVTAIDAATGDDANMAADVDINVIDDMTRAPARTNAAQRRPRPAPRPRSTAPAAPATCDAEPLEPAPTATNDRL